MNYLMDTANRNRMGLSPDTPQGKWIDTEFYQKYAIFIETYREWENPATRTSLVNTDLTCAQKEFEAVYRQLYSGFLRQSPLVTEADLIAMGFPARREGRRKRVPVPNSSPTATVHLPSSGVVEIHYIDKSTHSRAKPDGVHGAEIAWKILDIPPEQWQSLTNISKSMRTPFRLSFDLDVQGKKLYFALRWENTRGEKGPWSAIRSTVIP
ncbi:MAG: hypothetical protein LBB73_05450 [Dysgonamonadaceae bacterium]|nr:hypothetical protein [Dysgonamonadaceae bacterium]